MRVLPVMEARQNLDDLAAHETRSSNGFDNAIRVLKLLALLGVEKLGYQATGGHELFRAEDAEERDATMEQIPRLNELMGSISSPAFINTNADPKKMGFSRVHRCH